MKKESLTAKQVQHAKAGEKQFEIAAGDGLYLVLHTTGRKSWRFRYRYRGRTRGVMLEKPYPQMSLAQARAQADAMLDALKKDKDPAVTQAEEISEATPDSIKAVADEWIKRHVKVHTGERTQDEFERILRKEILPHWKDKFIGEVSKPDVLRVLDFLSDRGTPALANKTLAVMKSFFSWCVERGYLDLSPAHKLKPPARSVSRERVLDEGELREIWNAAPTLGYPNGDFLHLLILLAQRRGEVSGMRWRHIDLEEGLWTIPGELMKGGRVHVVPLVPQVIELLKKLPRFKKGDHVFTTTSGEVAVNGFSKLKERIDAETLKRRNKAGIKRNIPDWCLHDIRRTGTTRMAELGTLPHVLSAILGHATAVSVSTMPSAAVTRIYNRYAYLDEKRSALQSWADYVLGLTATKEQKAATA